ncbi:MAG TPA: PLP-dependent aminotransferase family protein [Actinomadura sp.]|jgi:DNA-binding transcriptional MocR family regulator|nr:PLP-dependent aminotransferase family protein [Actinomadura sp.]
MEDYRLIADTIEADIAAGRLRPGDRLPAQRQFARRRGIASSTAARVYGELVRRGLAVGEVGRGTFVRAAKPALEPALTEPSGARVDLELNFSVLPEQPALLARSLERMARPAVLAEALLPVGVSGTPAAREAAAGLLSRAGWTPEPGRVLFAGNGRQALAAAIAALVPPGQRLGVEALTYPVVKAIAARLGVTLVPLPMDGAGLIPDAVRSAHRAAPLRAVYLQPTLHNPMGVTMHEQRRAEFADVLRESGLYAIEDAIYSFLRHRVRPLAALAPGHTILLDGLSKRIAPGLTVGFAVPPVGLVAGVAAALRSGGWTASRFALEAATSWLTDGTATAVQEAKRRDAEARQRVVRERLARFAVRSDPCAYHCWWELPEPWRADTFVAAAARRGIAVTPGAAFAVGPGQAPNAVRLALAAPAMEDLAAALDVLAALARGTPEDAGLE